MISFYDATNQDLRVAHCGSVACTLATSTSVDTANNVGQYSSITIGVNGLPIIRHYDGTNGGLRISVCSNVTCTSATTTAIDTVSTVGFESSMTIGADAALIISYRDGGVNGDRVARRHDLRSCIKLNCALPLSTVE